MPPGNSDFRVVAIARKSQSSDEASWVEDSVRVEGRFEPPHQRERPLRRSIEYADAVANLVGDPQDAQLPTSAMRDFTPSRDGLPHALRVREVRGKNLRDARARMRAVLRSALLQTRREIRRRHCDLSAQRSLGGLEVAHAFIR